MFEKPEKNDVSITELAYVYGIYQSSGTVCSYYKEDNSGNLSTFEVTAIPETDGGIKKVSLTIDTREITNKNWYGRSKNLTIADLYRYLGDWSSDADKEFKLKSKNGIRHLLRSELRVGEYTTETEVGGKGDLGVVGVKGQKKTTKTVKNKEKK